jgi:activating signal cointegrator complex subunit 1
MRFDASRLIERYRDFVWAQDVRVDKVQICKMGAKKIWSGEEVVDERYEVVYSKAIFD